MPGSFPVMPVPVADTPLSVLHLPGAKGSQIHERRLQAVPDALPWSVPAYIERGTGAWLIDVDGNSLIDMGSGIGVTSVGHSNPAVVAAITDQAQRFTHTLFGILPYEGYVLVAEHLDAKTPGDHPKKTVLVNSGSEGIETAVKVARKCTGRPGVAVLEHGFHGRTNLTMAMNHRLEPYGSGFGPFAGGVHHVPNSYPYRDGLSGSDAAARTIAALEHVGAEQFAALVVEPVQGEGGFIVPADGYLSALAKWATANGTLLVADEIQAGMGRTGRWFASEHFGIVPDIVVSAKALAAGLPLAAVTGRSEMMDTVQAGGLGGTFGGNPIAVAAANAVFDQIEQLNLLDEAVRIGEKLRSGLESIKRQHPVVGDVRGIGAMQAFELSDPESGAPLHGAASAVCSFACARGVILLATGSDGNVVRFLPNFTTSDDVLDCVLDVVGAALDNTFPR
ncbi:4-aminobutyrate--2-oxoglutarate transaminase [Pseudonocardia xishanensis]|uniref:4-aminobutyrate--2-oxoglutarate transaminase n=2 Tax=Pseudonocardia xishanensis TaxID=630995 RepID=A0ABP8RVW3_9PSEU